MRYGVRLGFALALITGCGEGPGTGSGGFDHTDGGTPGDAGSGGGVESNCWRGAAGGAGDLQPGLYDSLEEDPNEACFHVNEDCTGLAPSAECNYAGDGRGPQFLGINWINGVVTDSPDPEAIGEACSGALAVTAEMVTEIPIRRDGFTFSWTDEGGTTWVVQGDYSTSISHVEPSRRDPDGTVCAPIDPYQPDRHLILVSWY